MARGVLDVWVAVDCDAMFAGHLGFRVQGCGVRVQGAGFKVQDLGFRDQKSGFIVQVAGLNISSSIFRVLEFRVIPRGRGPRTSTKFLR